MVKDADPTATLTTYWRRLRKPLELELARGCPDTAIYGMGIGDYTRQWAELQHDGGEEIYHFALSLARGLRDYAAMPVAERRRRAMAAIDLLRGREEPATPAVKPAKSAKPATRTQSRPKKSEASTTSNKPENTALPLGQELLELSIDQLAPRAKWPKILTQRLGLYTVRDLLYHVPRDWMEIFRPRDLQDGARAAVVGTVARREYERAHSKTAPGPLYKYTLTLEDSDVELWITSFSIGSDRMKRGASSWSPSKLPFQPGQRIFALGKVERTGKIVELRMEDIYAVSDQEAETLRPGARVPLYALTLGVFQNQVHRAVMRVLAALGQDEAANDLIDPIPAAVRKEYGLLPLVAALHELHHPTRTELHESARARLAFEEFLIPQLVLARRHWEVRHSKAGEALSAPTSLADLASRLAPFTPTHAQQRVMGEIEADLQSTRPMNRLLQGDVGSGKTLVAASALAFAACAGVQAAMMAPTEILAEQLYLVLTRLLQPLGIAPVLLTGSVTGAERKAALSSLAEGRTLLAVGTHALIQEGVVFRNLGLAIIDEQHRFGVQQRATLRSKGRLPHTLVMTATPIPRTMALSVYGDLDLSILDEMPPGRHPVETRWASATHPEEVYRLVREQVSAGRQAYVLCPLVEQSDLLQADAATEMAAELQKRVFPDLRVGLLHGRLRPEEKDAAMEAFRRGETHILACTTVIEVGVDVPNATVMVIHNAERFGLAQLHQLRGRVGRSEHKSVCLLVTHPRYNPALADADDESSHARKRLRVVTESQDGFVIADADLALRGPGEYLGTKQSGLFDFQLATLPRDAAHLEAARKAAQSLIAADPDLAKPEHANLKTRAQRLKAKVDQFRE
ncbi:MAG: ATP-dependent DNA helicase RecG [Armatimonadota bacterium]